MEEYKSGAQKGQEQKERSIIISSAFNGAWNLVVAMVGSKMISEEQVWAKHDEVYKQYLERFSNAQLVDGELLKKMFSKPAIQPMPSAIQPQAIPQEITDAVEKIRSGGSLGVAEYEGLLAKYPGNASYHINEAKKAVRKTDKQLIPTVQY